MGLKPKPLVYVIAPFTKPDPIENTYRAILMATRLREDGLVTPLLPHLCLTWHLVYPAPPDVWYQYTLELESHCAAVLRADRRESKGGDNEEAAAKDIFKIPVFYDVSDLYKWVADVWRAKL